MAIIKNTKTVHNNGVKFIVYGAAGSGKTSLIPTLPNPIIISAESGLLSLSGLDIPYIEINSYESLQEAFSFIASSEESKKYDSIAIDSISEIGEIILSHEKKVNKDGRAAYGEMASQVLEVMRAFRDIDGKNIYFSAKSEKQQDENGKILYSPSMPGTKLSQQLPYLVDEVLALRVELDAEKNPVRALMTSSDGLWQAKDRSGKLDLWEAPDLGELIKKIGAK